MLVNKAKFVFGNFYPRLAVLHKRCVCTPAFQLIHLLLFQSQQFGLSVLLCNCCLSIDGGYTLSMRLHILVLRIMVLLLSNIQLLLLVCF